MGGGARIDIYQDAGGHLFPFLNEDICARCQAQNCIKSSALKNSEANYTSQFLCQAGVHCRTMGKMIPGAKASKTNANKHILNLRGKHGEARNHTGQEQADMIRVWNREISWVCVVFGMMASQLRAFGNLTKVKLSTDPSTIYQIRLLSKRQKRQQTPS